MQHIEDRFNREFRSRTTLMERIFDSPSLIVLDTSAFSGFLEGKKMNISDQQISAEYDLGFYAWLIDCLNEDTTFPSESLEEFRKGNETFSRLVRSSIKGTKKHVKGRTKSGQKHVHMSKDRKIDIYETNRKVRKSVKNRKKALKEFFNYHPLEEHIPEWVGRDLKSGDLDAPIIGIYNAVYDIASRRGVIVDYAERYGDKPIIVKEHNDNDQRIFTKCVAASYNRPVTLVTKDSDLKRIHKYFYIDLDTLSSKHHFLIPENRVILAFMSKNEMKVFFGDGTKEKIKNANYD
jgi:hypothetical protein